MAAMESFAFMTTQPAVKFLFRGAAGAAPLSQTDM
jgi:hypothetical protein